jgi:deoxyribodipyrimidine photo-lyase
MNVLVWFRGDLRVEDNPALRHAFEESDSVEAVYIYSDKQLKNHNEANVKIDFLIQHLFSLEKTLTSLNVPLTIIHSNGFEEDSALLKKYCIDRSIKKVFWNNQFGEDENLRDKKVLEALEFNKISVKTFHDQVIYKPGSLKTGQGNPYSVFTPFKRKWVENFKMDYLDINFQYVKRKAQDILSNVSSFDFNYSKTHRVNMGMWNIGESAAQKILHEFLDKKVMNYSNKSHLTLSCARNYFPQKVYS